MASASPVTASVTSHRGESQKARRPSPRFSGGPAVIPGPRPGGRPDCRGIRFPEAAGGCGTAPREPAYRVTGRTPLKLPTLQGSLVCLLRVANIAQAVAKAPTAAMTGRRAPGGGSEVDVALDPLEIVAGEREVR